MVLYECKKEQEVGFLGVCRKIKFNRRYDEVKIVTSGENTGGSLFHGFVSHAKNLPEWKLFLSIEIGIWQAWQVEIIKVRSHGTNGCN